MEPTTPRHRDDLIALALRIHVAAQGTFLCENCAHEHWNLDELLDQPGVCVFCYEGLAPGSSGHPTMPVD